MCKDADAKPKGSDSSTRINIRVVVVLPDTALANLDRLLSYYELFAVIKAKHSMSEEDRVFEQLLVHTQWLYALQHDRQFMWGMAVCGSSIRVCLLSPNEAVLTSMVMDITTGLGREAFIKSLVTCSPCNADQLGLDLTMTYLEDIKCWRIGCLMEDREKVPSYMYSDRAIVITDCLFSWHMQCFPRSFDMLPKGSELRHDVVIKDS
ncbi:hypothetical protein EV182_004123 [Spiromyces aspiralis]|uniref:Uncharacterized protein n=1 Tax=Spiromyces aspiralis TaxID=68401 RepID=A0ACC1HSR7_9FUNG|nr:hypothetical protein EV182_004123 [Spiromyces aspiralis]